MNKKLDEKSFQKLNTFGQNGIISLHKTNAPGVGVDILHQQVVAVGTGQSIKRWRKKFKLMTPVVQHFTQLLVCCSFMMFETVELR